MCVSMIKYQYENISIINIHQVVQSIKDADMNKIRTIRGNYELLYGGSSSIEKLKIVPVSISSE